VELSRRGGGELFVSGKKAVKNRQRQPTAGSFKPGQSGNPSGRPPGAVNKVTQEVRELTRGLVDDPEYQAGLRERLLEGKLPPAMETMVWHYAFGKPKETVEFKGEMDVRWRPKIGEAVESDD
jgi:hypothetical protein